MSISPGHWARFRDQGGDAVLVEVTAALGSTPREAGTFMVVARATVLGTIGGGQLEFLAIAHARKVLDALDAGASLDIPLGPELGQCCGGRVTLAFRRVDETVAQEIAERVETDYAARPHVYVFGAGHVGTALARALALLPYRTVVVDTRAEAIAGVTSDVETAHVALPEAVVRQAPAGAAFVVLTHEHGLDFLIAREALMRGDAAYVGMIGSRTKKATFRSWLRDEGHDTALLDGLTTPIGGTRVKDKRPEMIAALTAAEIVGALTVRKVGDDV